MINSLAIFSFITVVFGVSSYFSRKQPSIATILTFMYVLMVAGMQFYVNFDYIKQKCGGKGDYGTAFFNTIMPFLLIFVVIFMILRTFPSWKSPFSNTFGYLLARLMGVKTLLLDKILKPSIVSKDSGTTENTDTINVSLQKSLTMIYEDPSLLINSLTPSNMRDFTENSKELFRSGANEYYDKLYDFVIMKDIVAEYIWYFLSGLLVTAYSVSNIASLKCNVSAGDMIKLHRLHVQQHKDHVDENEPSNKTVYNISE
jgi:hypothetical protein